MSATPMPVEPRLAAAGSSGMVYRSLEHWRGVAALWVMLFHAVGSQEKLFHPGLELLGILARPGWLGVHLFFVISGYCIGANVYSLLKKRLGANDFLKDRLCRILPTYWAAFGVTLLLAMVASRFNHTTTADNLPTDARAWIGNLLLIQPYLGTKFYVIVYWTLVVELGFYVIVSVLIALAKVSVRLAIGAGLVFTLITVWIPRDPAWITLNCWPEFACGLLIFHAARADDAREPIRRNLCLGAVGVLGVLGWAINPFFQGIVSHSVSQLLFAAVFALFLYVLYPVDDAINRFRALRWLSFCGLFSYSLYLLHFPVGVRVYGLGTRFLPVESPLYGLLVIGYCLVCVLFSYGFYRMFEARFEVWRRRFKARPAAADIRSR